MSVDLQGSIRGCKVDVGWANRLESDRFMNSNNMMCPVWTGVDTAGRAVCADSFYAKRPGCNSASDRVLVENALRPQYIEYVNLDASGIRGDQGCNNPNNINSEMICHKNTIDSIYQKLDANGNIVQNGLTGQFGLTTGFQNIYPNCLSCQKGGPDQSGMNVEGYTRFNRNRRQQRNIF